MPVKVYSVDTLNNRKMNYEYLDKAIYIHETAMNTATMSTPLSESSAISLENAGTYEYYDQFSNLVLRSKHTKPITSVDYYILRFKNLALNNNDPKMGFSAGAISFDNPTQVTGDLSMCKNLQLLVFQSSTTEIPAGGATITVSKSVWKNPNHWLMEDYLSPLTNIVVKNEREIDAFVAYTKLK